MTFKSFILIAGLLCLSFTGDIIQVTLPDLDNKIFSLSEIKKYKSTAIIFFLSDCPASQSYTVTLNNMSSKYASQNIAFIGVFPGKYSTEEEMKKFRDDYKVKFPLLKDKEMVLAKRLGATVAPECFLINSNGEIIYKGRIDDWLYALGKKKMAVTEHNLEDAVNASIKNVPVKISETKPIGCFLEYDN